MIDKTEAAASSVVHSHRQTRLKRIVQHVEPEPCKYAVVQISNLNFG